jgi:hypothetical protein
VIDGADIHELGTSLVPLELREAMLGVADWYVQITTGRE